MSSLFTPVHRERRRPRFVARAGLTLVGLWLLASLAAHHPVWGAVLLTVVCAVAAGLSTSHLDPASRSLAAADVWLFIGAVAGIVTAGHAGPGWFLLLTPVLLTILGITAHLLPGEGSRAVLLLDAYAKGSRADGAWSYLALVTLLGGAALGVATVDATGSGLGAVLGVAVAVAPAARGWTDIRAEQTRLAAEEDRRAAERSLQSDRRAAIEAALSSPVLTFTSDEHGPVTVTVPLQRTATEFDPAGQVADLVDRLTPWGTWESEYATTGDPVATFTRVRPNAPTTTTTPSRSTR